MEGRNKETLEEFRRSFKYGSLTDLLFKFPGSRNINDQEVAEFLRGLLERLGDAFDHGDYNKVLQYVFQWQVHGYIPREGSPPGEAEFRYDSSPWTTLSKPLSQSRVGLLSAGGLYVEREDPMWPSAPTRAEAIPRINDFPRAAPVLSVISTDTDPRRFRVRHRGYDIRGALRDYNVGFPIDRLEELEAESV